MQTGEHITLVVFPFEDLSRQKEMGIFCRSFSADLITELSRFRQFRVNISPARESPVLSGATDQFEPVDSDYFIQGTFRCENERVRINVQLYNSDSLQMVWGNRLEGNINQVSEIQEDLLASVIGVLQQQINDDLLLRIRKKPKVEFKAYEHCLYGMEELKKGSLEKDLVARDHFQKALQIQPDYPLAHTGMSMTYFNEWSCQLWERWDVSKSGAYEWAQKAIELDDQDYIAAMVIGKIFLYDGSFDTAEYYFRKSLLLNSNDPDTLTQIALCFVFLGLYKEGTELYERAILLNPQHAGRYYVHGVLIYFEVGEYEKAASLINQTQQVKIASADAYYAAIYYYLQDREKMEKYWNRFLDMYRRLITKGKDFSSQEAINWIMKISPYRHNTNLEGFLNYISNGQFEKNFARAEKPVNGAEGEYCFLKESGSWKLSYQGTEVQVPELKGLFDIQKMLKEPRHLFHCAELMGSRLGGNGEKLIDEKARRQYQKKILELQSDIHEAELRSDFTGLEKLQYEYDRLIDHLSKSLGLKGKAREAGNTIEKARSAITWRIRHAIARIEQHHPLLGAHLSNAIKTGTLCSYQPDRKINWITS